MDGGYQKNGCKFYSVCSRQTAVKKNWGSPYPATDAKG